MTKGSESNKRWRDAHPVEYCFSTLRNNAKRRGIKFELSLEEFKMFCYKTRYIKRKGVFRDCYTIDRIRSWEGYNIHNIHILTNSANASKGAKVVEFNFDPANPFKVKKYKYVP